MVSENTGIVLQPGEGNTIRVPGHPVITTKVIGADTGGAYSLLEMTIYGEGPPLHVHKTEEEVFYVQSGEVEIRLGERTVKGTAGSVVLVPRGTPHTFWNVGTEPANLLVIFSPSGYERFFMEVAALKEEAGSPAYFDQVDAIRTKYNAELTK